MSDEGTSEKKPMTKEEVEAWIQLKDQYDERWFALHVLDEEVDADPTMRALMESLSETIWRGMRGLPFMESQQESKPDLSIIKPGGRSAKGDS